jgi:sugar lactone lactonase YvrE
MGIPDQSSMGFANWGAGPGNQPDEGRVSVTDFLEGEFHKKKPPPKQGP